MDLPNILDRFSVIISYSAPKREEQLMMRPSMAPRSTTVPSAAVFSIRFLTWLCVSLVVWLQLHRTLFAIDCVSLAALNALEATRPSARASAHVVIAGWEWLTIGAVIHVTGGLTSPYLWLFGVETVWPFALASMAQVLGLSAAMAFVYGFATHAWRSELFWWRIILFAGYLIGLNLLGKWQARRQLVCAPPSDACTDPGKRSAGSIDDSTDLLEPTVQSLLMSSVQLLSADAAVVWKRQQDDSYQVWASYGVDRRLPRTWPGPWPTDPVPQLSCASPSDDPAVLPVRWFHDHGFQAVVLMPLIWHRQRLGYLMVAARRRPATWPPSPAHIQGLTMMAITLLRTASLRRHLRARQRRLAALEHLTRMVNRNLEMEPLMRRLRDTVSREMPFDRFVVALTNADHPTTLSVPYQWVKGSEVKERAIAPYDEEVVNQVLRTRLPTWQTRPAGPAALNPQDTSVHAPHMLAVPLAFDQRVYGAIIVQSDETPYQAEHKQFLTAVAAQASVAVHNALAYRQSQQQAFEDHLTGLGNARRFNRDLHVLIAEAQNGFHPLTLLVIDSDSLKRINDRFGHQAGDQHLQWVSQIIRDTVPKTAVACRYAGDEFVIILPHQALADAMILAEKLRCRVASSPRSTTSDEPMDTTISIGLAQFAPGMTAEELFQAADRALYIAKMQGKNRVHAWSPDTGEVPETEQNP